MGDASGLVDGCGVLVGFEFRDADTDRLGLLGEHKALGVALLFGARVVGESCAQGDDVVGEDPCLGVSHDRGDGLRLPGDLGLLAEGFELTADLAGEVAQAGEVGLHRVELAESLLLAAAVLEDSCCFFDESAPVFRRCLQHGIETALADDHVHLTAEARVAQQLLHVEQTASGAVDGVFAGAVAEQRAADRDLGELDRQGTVAVVDRELHLGATEGSTRGGTGEDDVFHFAAAQGLRPLLSHDPGEGIHDI